MALPFCFPRALTLGVVVLVMLVVRVVWAPEWMIVSVPRRRTGEQEPSGPGHGTRNTTHRAGEPVNRSVVAQDTAHTTQRTERAHR